MSTTCCMLMTEPRLPLHGTTQALDIAGVDWEGVFISPRIKSLKGVYEDEWKCYFEMKSHWPYGALPVMKVPGQPMISQELCVCGSSSLLSISRMS